jgi:hypothetical protein
MDFVWKVHACISDPCWPGIFWITSLLYNTDATFEGEKSKNRVAGRKKRGEQAQVYLIHLIAPHRESLQYRDESFR